MAGFRGFLFNGSAIIIGQGPLIEIRGQDAAGSGLVSYGSAIIIGQGPLLEAWG